jgi:hypothetical protein
MKFGAFGLPAKRRIGNPRQNRFDAACDLAHRKQPEAFAARALK